MKGFWKKVITVGAIVGVSYLGYKAYRIVNSMNKLSKTLPDYLKTLLDEKPKVDVNLKINCISIAIGLSADTFENISFDLVEQIHCYIADYYPSLAKLKFNVQQYVRSENDSYDVSDDEAEYETVDSDESGEYHQD